MNLDDWIEEDINEIEKVETNKKKRGKIGKKKNDLFMKKEKETSLKEKEEEILDGETIHNDIEVLKWFQNATNEIVSSISTSKKGSKLKKTDLEEAKHRSKDLATTSDVLGVKFTGVAFQLSYYETKFSRRGTLLYNVMTQAFNTASSQEIMREILIDNPASKEEGILHVASFGGGPGTDSAGLVWVKRKILNPQIKNVHCVLMDYEKTWKKYVSTLQTIFGDDTVLSFSTCDVTKGKEDEMNKYISFNDFHLHIFSYVCHETFVAAKKSGYAFYKDLATQCRSSCIMIFLDVMSHSFETFQEIKTSMCSCEGVTVNEIFSSTKEKFASLKSDVMILNIKRTTKG